MTTKEIENSFAGNICRCTGYRPILDAFKSLATDLEESLQNKIHDLEDLANMKCLKKVCAKTCEDNKDWCIINNSESSDCLALELDANRWYKAFKIEDIFHILSREGVSSYRLVAGNTGKGLYRLIKRSNRQRNVDVVTSASGYDARYSASFLESFPTKNMFISIYGHAFYPM